MQVARDLDDTKLDELQIHVLGSIEASRGNRALALGGKTQRRLLALLLLAEGHVVSLDRMVDLTWPDDPPARGGHNVRTYVHRLRGVLGSAAEIATVEPGYRLTLKDASLDRDRFERLLGNARSRHSDGRFAASLESCIEALELWGGLPFGEFSYEDWARPEVVRLDELHNNALELEAELLFLSGRTGVALSKLESLIEDHPLRERPRALRLRALYASGRQTDALREFQAYRTHLVEEVGVEPSAELVELDRAIARGDLSAIVPAEPSIAGYQLHEALGQGAFAVVHRATQVSLDRDVAVKVIRAELANQPGFIRAFETEARAIARIEHPSVVPLYDFWRDPDRAYLVMKLMPGGSLRDRLAAGPLPTSATLAVVDDIASALDAAHSHGLVHRDVKPANILFDENDHAYLSDFGIALDLTSTARAPLSPEFARYAAPEQLAGARATSAADVYGLASVALAALTGITPFANSTSMEQLVANKQHGLLAGLTRLQNAPAAMLDVLAKAGSTDPAERPSSVLELASALRQAADGSDAGPPSAASQPGANPYVGLRPFDTNAAGRFFGRTRLVDELTDKLTESNSLAVVGASGSGKSSVVRAGLLPRLQHDERTSSWFTASMTPGAHPFEALETALLRIAVNPPASLVEQLRDPDRGLLRSIRRILPEDNAVLVLLVDQFEELFTAVEDPTIADAFLAALAIAATEPDTPLRLVLTMRADFYDRPLRHTTFAPVIKAATVAVTPLAPDELEQVIVAPARAAGKEFAPGLVPAIMADAASQPGSLPLLQYALTRAYDHSDGSLISADDYRAVGGILGSLTQQAEELYRELGRDQQNQLRRIMGQLVALGEGSEDTRRIALRSELGSGVDDILDAFGAARLLTFDNDPTSREPTVEVAHEALIREWPRLRSWLDEDRDDLRTERHLLAEARAWDTEGRPESDLFRGGRLETAEAWAADHEASPLAGEFVNASVALRQREIDAERERFEAQVTSNRRLRRALSGVAVLLACAMVAGLVAFQQRSNARSAAADADTAREEAVASEGLALAAADDADTARLSAEIARFDAETGRLVAQAQALAETNPRASMLLAAAAHQREQSPATLGGLQVALSKAGPLLGWLGYGTAYQDVHWLENDRIVGVRTDGLDLFDVSTRELLDTVAVDVGQRDVQDRADYGRTAVAADTTTLASISGDNEAIVFELGDSFTERYRVVVDEALISIGLNSDGSRLATAEHDSTVSIWSSTGSQLFGRDFDDNSTWVEQNPDIAGKPLEFFFATFAPRSTIVRTNDEELWFSVGAYVYRATWDGEILAGPTRLLISQGEQYYPASVRQVIVRNGIPEFMLTTLGGLSGQIDLSQRDLPSVIFPELVGGGAESLIETFQATGREVVGVLTDGTVARLDFGSASIERVVDIKLSSSEGAASSPADPNRMAITSPEGIALVSLAGAGPLNQAVERFGAPNLSISRNGRFVVAGGAGAFATATVYYRDSASFKIDPSSPSEEATFTGIAPDAVDILRIGLPDGVTIYSLEEDTIEAVAEIGIMEESSVSGDISPDGSVITEGLNDTRVMTFGTQNVLVRLPNPDGRSDEQTTGNRFHPFEPLFLVSTANGHSQLWNTTTWQPIENSIIDTADIALGYWSTDGSLLATASSSGQISVRNGSTFEVQSTMTGALGNSNFWNSGALLFSDDNSHLLTSFDGPGRLWDVETGEQIGVAFESHRSTNTGVNFGENLQLITGTEKHALIWNLNINEWPGIACTTAGSNLTRDEWTQWGPRDEDFRAICPEFPISG